MLLAISSANTAGSTKKAITSGVIFIGYNAGNIASAYLVIAKEKPIKYRSTWISVIVGMAVASAGSLYLRFWFSWENKRLAERAENVQPLSTASTPEEGEVDTKPKEASEAATRGLPGQLIDYVDRTEKHIPGFRYSL